LISIAYAMGQGGAGAEGAGGGFANLIPLVIMFAIFYFLLIRPQQKKAKEHRDLLGNLKKGDRILTNGGFHARIISLDENVMTVELADKVRVKMSRGYVAGLLSGQPDSKPDSE
jgi:preprotein translocase subunit YajC